MLGQVRGRKQDLEQIERTLAELADLFQSLEEMVVQQEKVVVHIEHETELAQADLAKGNVEIGVASKSALRRRKLKWVCLGIVVAIILIVALILGCYFGIPCNAGDPRPHCVGKLLQ